MWCCSNNELEAEQVTESSHSNSTDIISTSLIRNSFETVNLSQDNVVLRKKEVEFKKEIMNYLANAKDLLRKSEKKSIIFKEI